MRETEVNDSLTKINKPTVTSSHSPTENNGRNLKKTCNKNNTVFKLARARAKRGHPAS